MKIIENSTLTNEKLEISDLNEINGAFCGKYTACKGDGRIVTSCKPRIGGTNLCFNHLHDQKLMFTDGNE